MTIFEVIIDRAKDPGSGVFEYEEFPQRFFFDVDNKMDAESLAREKFRREIMHVLERKLDQFMQHCNVKSTAIYVEKLEESK